MDCSEASLDKMESQRSTGVSDDQRTPGYVPMNPIKKGSPSFSQSGGEEAMPPPTVKIDCPTEFLSDIKLSNLFDLPGETVEMDSETFSGVSDGNMECLEKLRSNGTPMACLKSIRGDSLLHLAAFWGRVELVKSIVTDSPCLLMVPNSKDRLPLHLAANGGHSDVVEALVATVTFILDKLSDAEERERLNLYVRKDKSGDTPLHLALKGRYSKVASSLVDANHQASFLVNDLEISPLYLAVETNDVSLVKAIINTKRIRDREERKSNFDSKLEGRRYLVHAALKSGSTDMLDVILLEYPSLVDERDNEGRSCLSFGASIGFYDGVCNLLNRSTKSVFQCNDDGTFPIHLAVEGDEGVVGELLKRCPGSKHLLNKRGENILHIAAKNGKYGLVKSLMADKDMGDLRFGQDVDGNTPLHLATKMWCSQSVACLALDVKTLQLRNNSGHRAQDIAEKEHKKNYIFKERLTLAVLLYSTYKSGCGEIKSITKPTEPLDHEKNRDYVNTLLLVAALVAAMTFTAAFTMPGGFNSSGPNLGRAILASNPTLVIFLLLDTLAMQCSVATIATLIWAQLGDPALVRSALNVALPLMFFALLCMPLTFLFGVATAVGHVKWLLAIILIISPTSFIGRSLPLRLMSCCSCHTFLPGDLVAIL